MNIKITLNMKTRIMRLVLCVFAFSIQLNLAAQNNLVASWTFNDGTANDQSGNNLHGTNYGATLTTDRFGNENSAFSFNGIDSYIDCGDIDGATLENLTITAWVYWTGNVINYGGVYVKGGSGIGRLVTNANGKLLVQNENGNFFSDNDGDLPANEWTFITYKYDQSAGKEYIYVNGIKKGEQNRTGNLPQYASSFIIGKGDSNLYKFSGKIDDVNVFNYPLSDTEIQDLYNAPPPPPKQLIGSWSFNDGTANDESGNSNNGTVNGATLTTDRFGNENAAYSFDGVDDYIDLGELNLGKTHTIIAWVKHSDFQFSVPIGGGEGYYAFWTNNGTKLYYRSNSYVFETKSLETEQWYQFVVTRNNESVDLYVDGVQIGNDKILSNNLDFLLKYIGRENERTDDYGYYFNGVVDDISVYNYALDTSEINELYRAEGPKQLVGSWSFNDGTANDESGNDNHGTVNGATLTTDRFGNENSAYDFDGTDDYIDCGDIDGTTNLENLTVTAWLYWTGVATQYGGIYNKGVSGIGRMLTNGAGKLLVQNGNGNFFSGNDGDLPANEWALVTYKYDQSAGKEYIYVNGVQKGEQTRTGNILENSHMFVIGKGDPNVYKFNGIIDDVTVYNYSLSVNEILEIYSSTDPKQLIGFWPFNDGTANDQSGNNNNGTINGATLTTDRFDNENSAFNFNGIDDRILVSTPELFDFKQDEDFSISLWFNPGGQLSSTGGLLGNGAGSNTKKGWSVRYNNDDLRFEISNGADARRFIQIAGSEITSNQWSHLLITADRDNLARIYLNGTLKSETDISGYNVDLTNANEFEIGRWLTSYFTGLIDDINVYNYVLSPQEISDLYNATNPTPRSYIYNSNIIAYYQLNGDATDAGSNNLNGTNYSVSPTTDRFGDETGAMNFDGMYNYIDLGDDQGLLNNVDNQSISFWFKQNTVPGSYHAIYQRLDDSDNGTQVYILSDGTLGFYTNSVLHNSNYVLNDNEWHHYAITAEQGTLKFYVDNNFINEITGVNIDDLTTPTVHTFGKYETTGLALGALDDVRFYNKTITSGEIAAIYSEEKSAEFMPAANLVLSEHVNLIHVSTPTKAYKTLPENGNYESVEEVQYFDGLGRPIQSIQIAASPTGKDMVQHIAYDEAGRETRKFLPFESGLAGGFYMHNAETEQDEFYKAHFEASESVNPWSEIEYEDSPLNRVMEQGAPGENWKVIRDTDGKSTREGKTIKFEYLINETIDDVAQYSINDSTGNLEKLSDYGAQTLYKTKTFDENGHITVEYKNSLGQVVCKVSDPEILNLQTYYVYNHKGLLSYVIPPKAVELIETHGITDNIKDNLCYQYGYDNRNRMIAKKLPGASPVFMVYDTRNRLVLTQDGNLGSDDEFSAPNNWLYTKYDELNRPIITGIYEAGALVTRSELQTAFDNFAKGEPVVINDTVTLYTINELYETPDDSEIGYTLNDSYPAEFPITESSILTITYYDNYDFDKYGISDYASVREYVESVDDIDYPVSEINDRVTGQITGTKTKILGEEIYLLTVNYYDNKYRVIRTYSENYLGGDDLMLTKYDFVGNVLRTKQIHYKDANTGAPVIVNQRMVYDHTFRLKQAYHEIEGDANGEVLMAQMEYNSLGELVTKHLHKAITGDFLQDIDFEYNIRGWLTKINDLENISDDLFAMQLAYNDGITGLSTTAQYNGNISAMKWVNSEEVSDHAYVFDYDNVNRLIKGDHFNGTIATTEFDLDHVSYDKNGNIEALIRYGASGIIDNLTYTYTDASSNYTNQLQQVDDASGSTDGFADVSGLDYAYDNNGNLTEDYNKGIVSISYNYLNLPEEIDFGSGDKISYIYDATGTKHAKYIDGNQTGDRYYIGNMEYNNAQELEFIHTSEGRVRTSLNEFNYDYYLKDHLGNTRVSFTENNITVGEAEALQVDNYYPFGMQFNQAPVLQVEENNYLYNGKELQKEYGLDWYDYGWRQYDPSLGRFHKLDRFSEKYIDWSPYQYAGNNPILFIDINGDSLATNNTELFFQDMQTIYGENNDYFSSDENGNIFMTKSGLNEIMSLAIEDSNSPLLHSLLGMSKVINSEEMTSLIYSSDVLKDENGNVIQVKDAVSGYLQQGITPNDLGGEVTITNVDNSNQKGNSIYVDPSQMHFLTVSSVKENLTPQDIMGNTQTVTTYPTPRANNVMHGIGHVLYKANNVQARVIEFDNYNRILNDLPSNTDPTKTHINR